MKKKIVIKFSGKVFAMENVKLLKDYARFLVKISKTYQPIIVAGGGKLQDTTLHTHVLPVLMNPPWMNLELRYRD